MKPCVIYLKSFISLAFLLPFIAIYTLFPLPTSSLDLDLPESVYELSQNFSEKFCFEISSGVDFQSAGEVSAKSIFKGLIFSPYIKEIMSVPKDELVSLVSSKIYKKCGRELAITKDQLKETLLEYAEKDRSTAEPKPFQPFGIG